MPSIDYLMSYVNHVSSLPDQEKKHFTEEEAEQIYWEVMFPPDYDELGFGG